MPETFALLAELAEANSNLTQAFRVHFAYVEDVLNSRDQARRERWFRRFADGDIVGGAWTEIGDAKMASFSTRISAKDGHLRLNGAKHYTTGSLFADWIDVGAVNNSDETVSAVVATKAPGVQIVDDWDGFGQKLTASGGATFTDVLVEPYHVANGEERFGYSAAYVQQVHHATLVESRALPPPTRRAPSPSDGETSRTPPRPVLALTRKCCKSWARFTSDLRRRCRHAEGSGGASAKL